MFEVSVLDAITFILVTFSSTPTLSVATFAKFVIKFVKKPLVPVTEFAAHMLLPGPFRYMFDEFTVKIPFGSRETLPFTVSKSTEPIVFEVPTVISWFVFWT